MSDAEPLLLRHEDAGVATLTLDRPRARNGLSTALLEALEDALAAIAADRSVKVVILAANGPVFCAGHDLKEMRALEGREAVAALFTRCTRVMTAIVRLPQPVIAKVDGMAAAAGCQLVASCDLAYASTRALFATSGINVGLFCATPAVPLSRAVGRKRALSMLFSGEPIDAATAEAWGLVNRAVPAERLDAEVMAMAATIASKSPHALALGKAAFHRQADLDLEQAYAHATETMITNMLAHDVAEGIDAFLAKRAPAWEGR